MRWCVCIVLNLDGWIYLQPIMLHQRPYPELFCYPMVIVQCLEGLLAGTNKVVIVLLNTDADVYNVQRNA